MVLGKVQGPSDVRLTPARGIDEEAADAPNSVSARYFQLKTNHAIIGANGLGTLRNS